MSAFDSAGGSATGSAGYPAHRGVDEQGAEAGGGRYLTLQDIDMVGQVIAFEPGVGQHHDGILHMIILKNRQGGIGRINGKTVLAFAPCADKILNHLMTRQVLRSIGEPDHNWTHIFKGQNPGTGIKFNAFSTLHKKHNFFAITY